MLRGSHQKELGVKETVYTVLVEQLGIPYDKVI